MNQEAFFLNMHESLKRKDINKINTKHYNTTHIFFYTIKYKNGVPYILFLLKKNKKKISLPNYNKEKINKEIRDIKNNISKIGNQKLNKLKKLEYSYKGIFEYSNDLYLFYNVKNVVDVYTYRVKDKYYWCTFYEILNYKRFLKCKVHKKLSNFLYDNIDLFKLYDTNYNEIKHPITIYLEVKKNDNILNIINAYDEEKQMNVCIHTNKVKKNKNMIRAILFYEVPDNIILNNAFYFPNNKHLSIISIFE